MADPDRIVVLAPNWLGDAVMALPAIGDLRHRYPRACLAVAARPGVAPLFAMAPGVDTVHALAWNGRPTNAGPFLRDVQAIRRMRPEMIVVLPNSFASALLARASGARVRAGYDTDGRSMLLTPAVARLPGSRHQTAYYQHLTATLGAGRLTLSPEIVVPAAGVQEAERLLREAGWDTPGPIAVCAPGAAYGTAKQWLPEHFATLAAQLAREGMHVVIVGSAGDTPAAKRIAAMVPADLRSRVIDVSGRTTLAGLAAVFGLARVCVSNDSGAMHLAAAVGVPLAALFGPTNEHETAPVPRQGVPARVLIHAVDCRPCMLRECPIDHPCMRDLQPARVHLAVQELIATAGTR
jgi:heptosyltransferase II